MRKLLLGLAIAFGARAAWSDCLDTTLVLKAGAPGYNNGVYDPNAANAVNSVIKNCTDASITVRLNLDATESGKFKDTIKLSNPIIIFGRTGKTTALTMNRAGTPPANVIDTLFTFTENNTSAPNLLADSSGNPVVLTGFGFARKAINNSTHTVSINGKGSRVADCHFWMADNSSSGTGALLDVTADSVLVERSLFRAPPDGAGRSSAIHTGNNANKVEIRSSVFFSTGLQMAASGTFHVFANTFVGSRNEYNAIIIGNGIGTNYDNAVIMHNLFAPKVDTLPPIVFSGAPTGCDSILRNAWSRGKPNLALAVNSGNSPVTLNGATGANVNTPLPKGFSNYGPNSGDIKDYPVTELRSDPLLARKNADFGKVFKAFLTGNWTGMSDVSTITGKSYFPGNTFVPFFAGKTWLTNIKVGAFVDQDTYDVPSPLDSGAQGASLKFAKDSTTSTRVKMTQAKFDVNYYKQTLLPEFAVFCFNNTLSKLTGSNDTAALKAGGSTCLSKPWSGSDSLLTVPTSVRNEGQDIYVKMLHYRGSLQAPVQSNAVIATISGFPSFPVNDLTLSKDDATSNYANKIMGLKVTRGSEPIDSIRIQTLNEGGQVIASTSKAVTGSSLSLTITVADKGNYFFNAVPVAKVNGTSKPGAATPNLGPIALGIISSDTVYVTYKTGGCPGADGTAGLPYCGMDSALAAVAGRKGGAIVVRNGSPVVPLEDITIAPMNGTDTSAVTIMSGRFDENRPIIRGKTKEALTITRKNVTLRGFTLEQPAGATKAALIIRAGGCVIDANIFRASTKGAVEAPAISVEVGSSAEARILNNVIWGFAKGVQFLNSSSPNVKVMFNTFVGDASLGGTGKTSGIYLSGTDEVAGVVADNFFSGLNDPIDTTLANKKVVLDHNIYTSAPRLHGLSESGGLDSSSAVASTDIWVTDYRSAIDRALSNVIDCNSLAPCNELYGGSSSNLYNVTVATDVFGKPRVNRKEVGAYEFPSAPSSVLGVLKISASTVDTSFQVIPFTVTGAAFDTAASESDSVQVFWTTSDVTKSIDVNLTGIPANQHKSYPVSKLATGSITDVGIVDKESTKYWFFAALSRNLTKTSRKLGYAYSDTVFSEANLVYDSCDFKLSNSACPSELGGFGVDTGTWKGKFISRVLLNEPITSGKVYAPKFVSVVDPNQFNLDLTSPLPTITLNTKISGLGTAKSKQKATWQIELKASPPDLTGLDLFLLPNDPKGLAQLVPAWSIAPIAGDRTRISIESSVDGLQTYAFGKLAANLDPGTAVPTDAAPNVYDFDVARDSAVYSIPVKFKGTGFKTANPLVLVSLIPAGGTVNPGSSGKPKVISKDYHSKTLVASAGYADLADSIRATRFYQHYLNAAAAEAGTPAPKGQAKPFTLDTVAASEFAAATQLIDADLAITGGEMAETTFKVPVGQLFKDFLKYKDEIGKASRSIEVEFTVFDGGKVGRTRTFIRTKFRNKDLQITERYGRQEFARSTHDNPHWNLFGYPWDEADSGSLARILGKEKWSHDNMRLMQYKGSATGGFADFIEYDGTNNQDIKYDSGMACWSGSTGAYTPSTAQGMSLDYQPFSLSPAPGQATDIALPFNFPIKWQDVLDSSGIAAANAPAMWHYNDTASGGPKWDAVQVFSTSPPTNGTVLMPWEGYTIKPAGTLTLKFPVMDSSRSTTPVAKTAANDGSWAVKVEASNASAAMDLRIGRGAREMTYPEAPNVPGQDFRVALAAGKDNLSQQILPLADGWQGHWALRGAAAQGSGGVSLRLLEATRPVPVWLVDVVHATMTPLSSRQPVHVSETDLQANDYHLVAGDQAYAEGVLQALAPAHLLALSNYPNPFMGSTLFRYALPASFGKTTFDLKVRDFRGRVVWEKMVQAGNSLSYLWDGHDKADRPLPAGVYSLSLTAKAEGKPVYRAVRNLLRM